MHSGRRTWRVRGVPRDFDRDRLACVLRDHPKLQCPHEDVPEHGATSDNGVSVHTLSLEFRGREQTATVRFHNLPSQLRTLGPSGQLPIDVDVTLTDPLVGTLRAEALPQSVKMTIDEHFRGITTLVSPSTDEEHQIDVVAVPGLGGHPFGSFVHKEDGNMWLIDNLPQDMPTARVILYGYNSELQNSTSLVQLDDLAKSLGMAIDQVLQSARRRLLLIGHSLGGLLIKEALIQFGESDLNPGLLDMILGLLLFGAPNDGMVIESLVPLVNDQPNRFLLESLNPMRSQVLDYQRHKFPRVLDRINCRLFCFYETKLSPTAAKDPITGQYKMNGPLRCLVSQTSATSCLPAHLVLEQSVAIGRTHSELVKFASHDSDYDNVAHVIGQCQQMFIPHQSQEKAEDQQRLQFRRELQLGSSVAGPATTPMEEPQDNQPARRHADELPPSLTKRSRTAGHLAEDQQQQAGSNPTLYSSSPHDETQKLRDELVKKLHFDKIDERLTHLTSALGSTCRWLLTKPEYRSWEDISQRPDHGGFLWITGHPGTGKSTLMKFLFEYAKSSAKKDPSQMTLSFFFLARGTVEEKTTIGLYRSLLHQLFSKAMDLRDSLDWMTVDGMDIIKRDGWHEEALKQTLKNAVQRLEHRSLTIFVDALDECDKNPDTDMVSFFEELCACATETKVWLKICFSSRHDPTVVMKGIELILEDATGHTEDIRHFIKSKLKLGRSEQVDSLRSEILQRSSGIFLWVVLVIGILNSEYPNNSVSIKKIREHLHQIPPKLDELFKLIITRDGGNVEQMHLCLKWILFAARPLKPQELYFAVQIGCDRDCTGYWDHEDVNLDDMKTFVRSSTKGLAEVTRTDAAEVQFIHESVRDFLLGKYEATWSGVSGNFIGHSHELLKSSCSAQLNASISDYIDIDGLDLIPDNDDDRKKLRETISVEFPLLSYASSEILHHADVAQENGIQQGQFLSEFPLERWKRLSSNIFSYICYTETASLLYVLAGENMANLIRIHPRRKSCFDFEDELLGAPILAALARLDDHGREAVCAFLKALTESAPPTSPLYTLCEQYCQEINKSSNLFIDPDIPHPGDVYSCLLNLNSKAIFSIYLIASQRFNFIDWDEDDDMALVLGAAEIGCEAVVRLLFEKCPNVESYTLERDGSLPWAAREGYEAVINLLLEKGADIEVQDRLWGDTPLILAVEYRQDPVCRLLVERGANISAKNQFGSTSLHAATCVANEPIIRFLLEKGADIEAKDDKGWTPLFEAMSKNDGPIVRLLLEKGADIEAKDNKGWTPFFHAISASNKPIVRLLLEKGVDIEVKDNMGWTPLFYAISDDNGPITRLLLEKGVDIEVKDNKGRTPLAFAKTLESWEYPVGSRYSDLVSILEAWSSDKLGPSSSR